ncbi:MAG: hypothetical protein ACRC28_10885 [Clostridium sp.]
MSFILTIRNVNAGVEFLITKQEASFILTIRNVNQEKAIADLLFDEVLS